MIKVIVPGKEFLTIRIGTCHKCACVIECDLADIIYPDRLGSSGYVQCPTKGCNAHICRFEEKRHPKQCDTGVPSRDA